MTPSQAASPADPLGFDVLITSDLDPSGRDGSGVELVLAAILHRLMADKILMTGAPDDQIDFGEDIRKWVGQAFTQATLDAKTPRIEEVLRRDRRIADLTVSITAAPLDDKSRWRLLVFINATLINGVQVDRIVGVDAVTVDFIAQGK